MKSFAWTGECFKIKIKKSHAWDTNVYILSTSRYVREIREVVFETVQALKEGNVWSKMKFL